MNGRTAVFLDRDGTLTEPRHYPTRPADLVLQPGIGGPLLALQRAGVALVLTTNQSGLARGYFTAADLDAMHRHLRSELGSLGVRLDAIYVCPHHPAGTVTALAIPCECRKPRPGMLLRAAGEHGLDLRRSWMVGDFASDIGAGRAAGCRTARVGPGTDDTGDHGLPDLRTPGTAEALRAIADDLAGSR